MTTTTVETTQTKEFLEQHGMDYTVSKQPAIQRTFDQGGEPQYNEVEGQYHLVRSSDQAVVSPKTVSGKYVTTNPRSMISPVAPLIAEGWITPKVGLKLSNGSHEMLRFQIDGGRLPEGGKMVGDEFGHYFQIHNFHGGGAFFGNLYCLRRRCTNGAVALVSKGKGFSFRHMGALQTKYEDAMRTWKEISDEIRKISERMTVWSETTITAKAATNLFHEIYGIEDPSDIPTRTANELQFAISEFSNPSRGTEGKSLYDVYNAITATNTHYSPVNSRETEVKRLSSLLNPNGARYRLEARTIEILSSLN